MRLYMCVCMFVHLYQWIYIYALIYGRRYFNFLYILLYFPRKYGRPDNSTTYCSDTATQYTIKIR